MENVKLAESIINNIVQIFTQQSRTGTNFEEFLNKGCTDIINNSTLSDAENEILTEILKLLSPNNQTNGE